jgi:FkbM family methyltransferase
VGLATSTAKAAVRRLGLEGPARRLLGKAPSAASSRNDRDDEHLALLLAFTLAADAHCIDVGAHDGALLRTMVELAPAGRHLAFEPIPGFAAHLRAEFPTVDVREAALGDAAGSASFVHVTNDPAYSGLKRRDLPAGAQTEQITVDVVRLDDVLPEGFRPDFIKVDVEGGELQVFRGALETLRKHQPVIWFEHGIGGSDKYGTSPDDIFDVLVDQVSLRIFDSDGKGPYTRAEFNAVFTEPMWNFVARP